MRKILIFILLTLLFVPSASAVWWNDSWIYKTDTAIANGTRPYQISLNVSNATGTNNATYIFCNGHCNVNFTDIRFTSDNTTELPYWIDNVTTGKVWVNVTTNGTVNMYYGNTAATSTSDGTNTFELFDDFEGAGKLSWTNYEGTWANDAGYRKQTGTTTKNYPLSYLSPTTLTSYIIGVKMYAPTIPTFNGREGVILETSNDVTTNQYGITSTSLFEATKLSTIYNNVAWNGDALTGITRQNGVWYQLEGLRSTNIQKGRLYALGTTAPEWTTSTTLASLAKSTVGLFGGYNTVVWFDDFYVRRYVATEPIWSTWGVEQSSYSNNYTNDRTLNFSVLKGTTVQFLIYNGTITNWYVEGVSQGVSTNYFNYTFISNNISINIIVDPTVGANVTWNITIIPPITLLSATPTSIFKCQPSIITFTTNQIGVTAVNAYLVSVKAVQPMIPGSGRTNFETQNTTVVMTSTDGLTWTGIFGNDATLLWGNRSITLGVSDGGYSLVSSPIQIMVYSDQCTGTGATNYTQINVPQGKYTSMLYNTNLNLLEWSMYAWIEMWGMLFFVLVIFTVSVSMFMKTQNTLSTLVTFLIAVMLVGYANYIPITYLLFISLVGVIILGSTWLKIFTKEN